MHPALRKGPRFTKKTPPPFHYQPTGWLRWSLSGVVLVRCVVLSGGRLTDEAQPRRHRLDRRRTSRLRLVLPHRQEGALVVILQLTVSASSCLMYRRIGRYRHPRRRYRRLTLTLSHVNSTIAEQNTPPVIIFILLQNEHYPFGGQFCSDL